MRLYIRRCFKCSILAFCGVIFMVTVVQNTRDLSYYENAADLPNLKGSGEKNPPNEQIREPPYQQEQRPQRQPRYGNMSRDVTTPKSRPVRESHETRRPINSSAFRALLPVGERGHIYNDRILEQLQFAPRNPIKRTVIIYAPDGIGETPEGASRFKDDQCAISDCYLTSDLTKEKQADAMLVQNGVEAGRFRKRPGQIWILWILESPMNSVTFDYLGDRVNWTASYRSDSTIVTPYEKFRTFPNASGRALPSPAKNYARGKRKLIAWFVSNCDTSNRRMGYVKDLREHLGVHVYGACGQLVCARWKGGDCNKLLRTTFKFYLSFENSNCEYYITEKLFWNALLNDVVPIVMGARKADYLAAAPPGSFIHVEDFNSAAELAAYLKKLDKDDDAYNEYFRWKGTGAFINTKFWCRLCAMLHETDKTVTWYKNVEQWWRSNGTCTKDRWDRSRDLVRDWSELSYV